MELVKLQAAGGGIRPLVRLSQVTFAQYPKQVLNEETGIQVRRRGAKVDEERCGSADGPAVASNFDNDGDLQASETRLGLAIGWRGGNQEQFEARQRQPAEKEHLKLHSMAL